MKTFKIYSYETGTFVGTVIAPNEMQAIWKFRASASYNFPDGLKAVKEVD
jgi:hypothetical protein